MFSWKITTRCLIGVAVPEVIQLLAELVWVWRVGHGRLGAAFRRRGWALDGSGADDRVTPGLPMSGTDRGWAFAHLALLESAG